MAVTVEAIVRVGEPAAPSHSKQSLRDAIRHKSRLRAYPRSHVSSESSKFRRDNGAVFAVISRYGHKNSIIGSRNLEIPADKRGVLPFAVRSWIGSESEAFVLVRFCYIVTALPAWYPDHRIERQTHHRSMRASGYH